jgi:hypothetical protein
MRSAPTTTIALPKFPPAVLVVEDDQPLHDCAFLDRQAQIEGTVPRWVVVLQSEVLSVRGSVQWSGNDDLAVTDWHLDVCDGCGIALSRMGLPTLIDMHQCHPATSTYASHKPVWPIFSRSIAMLEAHSWSD